MFVFNLILEGVMLTRVIVLLSLLLTCALPFVFARKAHAIAAFTRQHKTECSTCHTLYPELNEYGQAFLKNGYVYSEKRKGEKEAEKGVGAEKGETKSDAGKSDKNEGIRLSGIPELLPLSLTANQSIIYNDKSLDGDDWNFSTRDVVLQAGGAFRDLAGFYATYNLYTHATNSVQNDNNKLDELFMVWRHLLGSPVNIKFGKFEPRLSLWKKSDKIIVTSFATSAFKTGSSPFSMETTQDALEANAVLGGRVFVAGGVVDSKGQNSKDGYGHVSVKFGGADFLGNEPEIDFEHESIWDYLTLTMAAYGYAGRNSDPFGSFNRNDFYRTGGDIDLLYKRWRLRLSAVSGRDANPDYMTVKQQAKPLVMASEVEYFFGSPVNFAGIFRCEYQDSGTGIIRRYIPAVAYTPLQNVKFVLQYDHEDAPLFTNKLALLDVSFSF
jgi:hypothetical protein